MNDEKVIVGKEDLQIILRAILSDDPAKLQAIKDENEKHYFDANFSENALGRLLSALKNPATL